MTIKLSDINISNIESNLQNIDSIEKVLITGDNLNKDFKVRDNTIIAVIGDKKILFTIELTVLLFNGPITLYKDAMCIMIELQKIIGGKIIEDKQTIK